MTNCRWVKLCINLQKLLCIVELVSKMLLPSLSATHVFLLEPIKTKKFIYVTINYEDNENILIKYLRKSINYEWRMRQIVSPILQLQIYEFLARKWNCYLLDILCRQQIKLFQVVSTSEFHEYWWNDIENIFLVPAAFCRASEAKSQSRP